MTALPRGGQPLLTDRVPFATQLQRYGPDRTPVSISREDAQSYCRQLAESHYENFSVVSRLVPQHLRQHFCNLYAYCRWADDLADEVDGSPESLRLLQWWREELTACYQGKVSHPVFVALGETIHEFEIPATPFRRLLDAFERDQRQSRYETIDDLLDYCAHSANPVGHLILYLDAAYNSESARYSDSVCTGLQLANFLQDVSDDFQRGRIYVPQETLVRFGCTEESFRTQRLDDSWSEMMDFEVTRAEQMLRAGGPILDLVSPPLRWQVELFINGGLAILAQIRKANFDVWSDRPTVGKATKLRLVAGAWFRNKIYSAKHHG